MAWDVELAGQFAKVVDFPVEGHDIAAVGGFHRLAPRLGQIENRQPSVPEGQSTLVEDTLAVRSPRLQDLQHPADNAAIIRDFPRTVDPRDPAHLRRSPRTG